MDTLQITGISIDSRRVQSGELFVCIEGSHADGHHFIPHAISQGTTLIIAKLQVPGAELALYTDADPTNPDLAHLYQEPYYHMAENDAITMEACSDEMAKVYDKMQGFGEKNKLNDVEIEQLQMAGAMRCISSALNYNFDHWETMEGARCLLARHSSHLAVPPVDTARCCMRHAVYGAWL